MIGWILAISCIFGTVLNCKKIKWCFLIWFICNIAWFILDFSTQQYGRCVLDTVQTITAIWGFIEWSKNEN